MGPHRISRSQVRVLPGAQTCTSSTQSPSIGKANRGPWSTNGPLSRAVASLDRPHSRRRRTLDHNLKRLAAWPAVAAAITLTLIGATQPDTLTADTPGQQMVIER